jgi:elongation factor P
MLSYTELKKGVIFVLDGEPYEIIDSEFLRMQHRKAVVKTKIRNLISGKLLDRTWQASDYFEEVEIERKEADFIYMNRGECWFNYSDNPKNRFQLSESTIADIAPFLKADTKVTAWMFRDKVIRIEIPIKMEFEVTDAPPSIKGNTAQGGTKLVTIEGGAKISAPLFVDTGDFIRINTQTREYVERVDRR